MTKRFTFTVDFGEVGEDEKFVAMVACKLFIPKDTTVREMTAFAAALECVCYDIMQCSMVTMAEDGRIEKAVEEAKMFKETAAVIKENLHHFLSIVRREDDNIPSPKL